MEFTFEAVRADISRRLSEAASDRNSPMHTPVVATSDADCRIMVLRAFDAQQWQLRFHTDVRAPKVEAIGAEASVGVLFYDREAKIQIRCHGQGRIEENTDRAKAAWQDSDAFARRCYLGSAPGEQTEVPSSGLPDWIQGERPTEEQLEPARANFAILIVELERVDWYHLSSGGHRRAVFENGEGRWVTP